MYHYEPVGSPEKNKTKNKADKKQLPIIPRSPSLRHQPQPSIKAADLKVGRAVKGSALSANRAGPTAAAKQHARTSARSGEEEGKTVKQKSCRCE